MTVKWKIFLDQSFYSVLKLGTFPKKKFKIPVDTSTFTNSVENRAILTKYRLQVSVANKCSISSRVCQTFICHKS